MSFRHQHSGYISYSLLLITLLLAPFAIAQTDTPQQPAKPTEATSVQARIRARREQRTVQQINEIYSSRYEVFFGGGYQRFLPGNLQHASLRSWDVGLSRYYTRKLAATVDFRGQYGEAYTYNNPYHINTPSISQYAFLVGPQYRFYARPKVAISARVLGGGIYGNFSNDTRNLANQLGLYPDGTVAAVNAALPIDFNLSPKLAVRIAPDYLFTNFGSTTQHNRGVTANIVYRFGK